MARHRFGGTAADWLFSVDSSTGDATPLASAELTLWDALSGGDQYGAAPAIDDGTGLQDGSGVPTTGITTDLHGFLPDNLLGPNGVYRMAADANNGAGPRVWIIANDLGAYIAGL